MRHGVFQSGEGGDEVEEEEEEQPPKMKVSPKPADNTDRQETANQQSTGPSVTCKLRYYYRHPSMYKFIQLLNSENKNELIRLSKFIKEAIDVRNAQNIIQT